MTIKNCRNALILNKRWFILQDQDQCGLVIDGKLYLCPIHFDKASDKRTSHNEGLVQEKI